MDADKVFTKLTTGRLTRRDLHTALTASGLALVFAPLLPRAARSAPEDHPTFYTWAGYEVPEMHQSYIKKYGESPNFAVWGDEEEAFAKMRSGYNPDMTMPCSYKVTPWHDAGLLAPMDFSRLSNWPDVLEPLRDVPDTSFGEERPWVCAWWGLTSVTYRTDLVDIQEESLGLLWDERYKGQLSMFDSLIDGVMMAAIYAGAKDPFNMTSEEVAKVRDLMMKQKPLLRFYSNSTTEIEQGLASGELVAAATWNDSPLRLKQQGLPVKFMQPKEGAMTWTCGLALMKSADPAKLDRTYDLIDAFLSPETGEYWMMNFGMGHSNKKAFDRVPAAELEARGLPRDPEPYLKAGIFQATIRNEPELQRMFEEVKAGA
jgi:spermidine/putrescine transport system substrate-binding protein